MDRDRSCLPFRRLRRQSEVAISTLALDIPRYHAPLEREVESDDLPDALDMHHRAVPTVSLAVALPSD